MQFQPKGLSRTAESASTVPISVEARPAIVRGDATRGGRSQRGARDVASRAPGGVTAAGGLRQADISGKVPLTGSKGVHAPLPAASESESMAATSIDVEDIDTFGATDAGDEVAQQDEEDRLAADKFDADWPPKLESELRPITLPFSLGAPEEAASHAEASASSAFIDSFSHEASAEGGRARKRKRGVYASSNVAAAAGYGVTAAHTRLDATPLQCAHVFFDLERYQRHLEIVQSGEEDTDWPTDGADYVPLQEGKLLHFVLPSSMPLTQHLSSSHKLPRVDEDELGSVADPSTAIRDRVKEIPEGTLGKVCRVCLRCRMRHLWISSCVQIALLKNGQVRMKVGDLIFDVTSGLPRSMYEQFVAVLPDPSLSAQDAATAVKRSLRFKRFCQLGKVGATLTVTPNVDSMLSTMQVSQTRQPTTYAALAKELEEHPLLHTKSSKTRARANSHTSVTDVAE
jgi:hypothetical protein